MLQPDSRRLATAAAVQLVEPKTEAGLYPGASWPEYQRPARTAAVVRRAVRLADGAALRRRRRLGRAALRPARLRQLLLGARRAAGARPVLPRRTKSRSAGGAPVAVISHRLWQSRFAGCARRRSAAPSGSTAASSRSSASRRRSSRARPRSAIRRRGCRPRSRRSWRTAPASSTTAACAATR